MSRLQLADGVWCIENALPVEVFGGLFEQVSRIEELGLAQLYKAGTCNPAFWYPLSRTPVNIVERAVEKLFVHAAKAGACIGAEWWFNIRPSTDGMRSHFDKDESLLRRTRELRNPEWASVLYLSEIGLPTFCANLDATDFFQPPQLRDKSRPRVHVFVPPKANRYLVFRGDFWHGCAKPEHSTLMLTEHPAKPRIVLAVNWWKQKPEEPGCIDGPEDLMFHFARLVNCDRG